MKENKDQVKDAGRYAGVAVDASDKEEVTAKEVEQRTDVLDSNEFIDPTDTEEIPP